MDAGNQVLKPLDDIFEKIDKNGYLIVSAGNEVKNKDLIPEEYTSIFDLDRNRMDDGIITAGIFGFNSENIQISNLTKTLFDCGKEGLCLGYSKTEQWKNKGVNKNIFIRNTKYFRHDNTLLCALVLKFVPKALIEHDEFFNWTLTSSKTQYVWNLRLNYKKLNYLYFNKKSKSNTLIKTINKIYLDLFLLLKELNRIVKKNKY